MVKHQNLEFRKAVLGFYKKHGRGHLPWRKTTNPYRILISEVMLQQTQVERVILKYKSFLKKFPTLYSLARAPLSSVLREWQGLGYNRRAKMLHTTAKTTIVNYSGRMPTSYDELVALPGVGPYTASAVRVFAFNKPDLLIETNIRAALLHHFFPRAQKVHDRELLQLTVTPANVSPREWYAALMDYGAHLKATVPNPSRRSAHHVLQKPFRGSDREIRGAILRTLSQKTQTAQEILGLGFSAARTKKQLSALMREKLITFRALRYTLHD